MPPAVWSSLSCGLQEQPSSGKSLQFLHVVVSVMYRYVQPQRGE